MNGRRPAGAAADARGPCDKGLGGGGRTSSPMPCTAFGLVAGAGCPQCGGCQADRMRMLTLRFHRVSSGAGAGMSTPKSVRSSSGFRRSPPNSTARRVDAGERYPHGRIRIPTLRRAPAPFGCTGLRVGSVARYPHRHPPAQRADAPVRSRKRRGMSAFHRGVLDARMPVSVWMTGSARCRGAVELIDECSREVERGRADRVWIARPTTTQNAVKFNGEHQHAIERGCQFGCG
ncbi:hypothetical protein GEM_0498 [Burkholderia cepacia GG4]|uniref:Uncharacterized protein n=1 Tax=Burkholderia cepacia GG4 TaxID=1009846 RepID=A0A9W3JWY7_BURCE|nr:hypothetical protein GEM_0498 [Burkholderia cepacia GG4]